MGHGEEKALIRLEGRESYRIIVGKLLLLLSKLKTCGSDRLAAWLFIGGWFEEDEDEDE
jgi:hypothetical protein